MGVSRKKELLLHLTYAMALGLRVIFDQYNLTDQHLLGSFIAVLESIANIC